jgi:hypothetical protein
MGMLLAKGGKTNASNIKTLCQAQNLPLAEAEFEKEAVHFARESLHYGENQSCLK